jgi:hypothetical protein
VQPATTLPPELRASSPTATRIIASFLALFLGYPFVFGTIQGLWRDHWLVNDAQLGAALVIQEAGHGRVIYQYRVGQKLHTGQDHRSENQKYVHAMSRREGEDTAIYFSSSRPWISAVNLGHNEMCERSTEGSFFLWVKFQEWEMLQILGDQLGD